MTFVLTARSKTKQVTPAQRVAKRKAMPNRSVTDSPSGLAGLGGLQVNSCTNAPTIQPNLKIGEPNDKFGGTRIRVEPASSLVSKLLDFAALSILRTN